MASVLVTGGAGFVGSTVALHLVEAGHTVSAIDNLKRRGSELNLPRLAAGGVRFAHADVREPADLAGFDDLDVIVECSAEPSALAGLDGATAYLLDANVAGAYRCFDLARRTGSHVIFLSTSRVYPYERLNSAALEERETRFVLADEQSCRGLSGSGVAETFPLEGPRTLYGGSKLAAEILLEEFGAAYGINWTIDRCGVIAGPWQMGKADQGVFVHWARAHWFGAPLSYIGYGGSGKQVRDLIHVDDLAELIADQIERPGVWRQTLQNVGGGTDCSLSLRETTELCRELTGRATKIREEPEGRHGDVPVYITDCSRLYSRTAWRPRRGREEIMGDIVKWIRENEEAVAALPL